MPRGGKRAGSGRPAADEPMRRVTVSLPVSLLDVIDRQAYQGSNRSETISRLLQLALRADRSNH
jgi:metal-responsive CopG/Arc/MetJ family transcriptional regulator